MKHKLFMGVCLVILLTGCSSSQTLHKNAAKIQHDSNIISNKSSETSNNKINSSLEQEQIMNEFNKLINTKDISEQEIIKFVDHNIKNISSDNASKLVLGIEEVQNKNYEKRINSFFEGNIQTKISKAFAYKNNIDILDTMKGLDNVKDYELKKYLSEIIQCGYKIISSEGQYYPIQNYEYLKKYNNYITYDIKEYINIKSLDSAHPSTSDAAIIISWDEIFQRALKSENFLKKYPFSHKFEDIKQHYLFYAATYLYGTNNSPSFDYINNKLSNDILESYRTVSSNKSLKGDLVEITKNYLDILKKYNYKLTDEVETYRKNALNTLAKIYTN
ncbi:hypothetical protein [Clostridium sp. ZS2-4]|uniref:hypothetical protein n=1 Tax=Clostridium sp. ZS2-4 TaxID=2987703 RepID=UPI00227A7D35|nr:hypothetical protein [Clostridium sp. ZS2-4]MCY6355572.1 hypothetical protein [Clostridium sp. ZS2-4]